MCINFALETAAAAGIDEGLFKWLIGGMALAMVALCGYMRILIANQDKKIAEKDAKISELYDKRIADLHEQMQLTNTLEDVTYRQRKTKGETDERLRKG
jgi:hypothetical protein